jgi:hypothetical protein
MGQLLIGQIFNGTNVSWTFNSGSSDVTPKTVPSELKIHWKWEFVEDQDGYLKIIKFLSRFHVPHNQLTNVI